MDYIAFFLGLIGFGLLGCAAILVLIWQELTGLHAIAHDWQLGNEMRSRRELARLDRADQEERQAAIDRKVAQDLADAQKNVQALARALKPRKAKPPAQGTLPVDTGAA